MRKGFLLSPSPRKQEKGTDSKDNKQETAAQKQKEENLQTSTVPNNSDTVTPNKSSPAAAAPKSPAGAGATEAAAGATAASAPGATAAPTAATPCKSKKRRRTRSRNPSLSPSPGRAGFVVPGFTSGADNTKMTTAELMDASKGITNMALAHEIAVDKDFQLTKLEPNSQMESTIKEIMQRAFWDVLEDQLGRDPPVYSQALVLLTEIKGMLLSLLLPQHGKLKDKIEEVLDLELIEQQIESETLQFEQYAGYILGIMGMLCAPVRDDKINELKQTKQVVPIFRGIMETLDLMKIDMANFAIQQARPLIMSRSVDYEKTKFKEFLESVDDGLVQTRQWLMRHSPSAEEMEDPKYKKLLGTRLLNEAFVEILEWDDYYNLPETLTMDAKRILALRDQVERTAVGTAVILLSFSSFNSLVVPQDSMKLKQKIKQHVDVLLQDFFEDDDLLKILPGVGLQVVKDVNDYLEEKKREPLAKPLADNLCHQIESLEDPNHRIRDLVQKRIIEFNKQVISGGVKPGMQVPPGLTLCQRELGQIAASFVRLVNYNKQVFGEHYTEIINNHCLFKPTQ